MRKILAIVVFFALIFLVGGCAGTRAARGGKVGTATVFLKVFYPSCPDYAT